MPNQKKDPINKQSKSVKREMFNRAQPIRDIVSEIINSEDTSAEERGYIQNELRRLSRIIKKTKNNS